MKTVGIIILFIWLGGAALMGIVYSLSDRANCIKDEGVIKGLLWCDSQPKTRMGVAGTHASNFIQGALWPIQLVRYFSGNENVQYEGNTQYQQEYLCHEMIADIRSGTEAANQRILSRFYNEIFAAEHSESVQRMGRYARAYYGRKPSQQELSKFSRQSLKKGIGICVNNPLLKVEQAVYIGAEELVTNR